MVTCEHDQRCAEIAKAYFQESPFAGNIQLHTCKADDLLQSLLRKNLEVASFDSLGNGRKLEQFDFVFIDADKKSYLKYLETILGFSLSPPPPSSSLPTSPHFPSLLSDTAIIVVDNTLWKGTIYN